MGDIETLEMGVIKYKFFDKENKEVPIKEIDNLIRKAINRRIPRQRWKPCIETFGIIYCLCFPFSNDVGSEIELYSPGSLEIVKWAAEKDDTTASLTPFSEFNDNKKAILKAVNYLIKKGYYSYANTYTSVFFRNPMDGVKTEEEKLELVKQWYLNHLSSGGIPSRQDNSKLDEYAPQKNTIENEKEEEEEEEEEEKGNDSGYDSDRESTVPFKLLPFPTRKKANLFHPYNQTK